MAPICLPDSGLHARRLETGGQRRLQSIENDALAAHLLSADKKPFNSRISPAAGHEARFRAAADGALTNPSGQGGHRSDLAQADAQVANGDVPAFLNLDCHPRAGRRHVPLTERGQARPGPVEPASRVS